MDGLNIKVIIVIIVIVGFILSIGIVLFSIVIDVIRFVSLSILISLCNKATIPMKATTTLMK